MDAEALHHAVAARDAAIGHRPHQVVHGLGLERDEVVERIMGRAALRHLVIGLGLHGMREVRELDAVLDEEDGHVVADEIEVALLGVELHREAAHGVGRAA